MREAAVIGVTNWFVEGAAGAKDWLEDHETLECLWQESRNQSPGSFEESASL